MSERPAPRQPARLLAGALALGLAGVVAWALITGEPGEQDRVAALGARIRCPVCQGESIADSPAEYARDMMDFVTARVADGWSDEQILDHLEQRFAGIRLDPPFAGGTLLLWILPAAAAGAGGALIARRLRRRKPSRPGGTSDDRPLPPGAAP